MQVRIHPRSNWPSAKARLAPNLVLRLALHCYRSPCRFARSARGMRCLGGVVAVHWNTWQSKHMIRNMHLQIMDIANMYTHAHIYIYGRIVCIRTFIHALCLHCITRYGRYVYWCMNTHAHWHICICLYLLLFFKRVWARPIGVIPVQALANKGNWI